MSTRAEETARKRPASASQRQTSCSKLLHTPFTPSGSKDQMMLPCLLLIVLIGVSAAEISVQFDPSAGVKVHEDETASFTVLISSTAPTLKTASLSITDDVMGIAEILTPEFDLQGKLTTRNISVNVSGIFVGLAKIKLQVEETDGAVFSTTYGIAVLRSLSSSLGTTVFIVCVTIAGFLNDTFVGIQLDRHIIWRIVKKPVLPAIGIICQWGLMGPLAVLWGYLILDGNVQQMFSLFLIGCCPGGGQSNKFTLLLDGNLDLSITLTFLSSMASLGMMPAWVYSLGRIYTSRLGLGDRAITIPFANIISAAVLAILPALIGMCIRHKRPDWAGKTLGSTKCISLLFAACVLPASVYVNLYIFSYFTWRTMLAGAALPASGFLIALAAGYLSYLPRKGVSIADAYADAICLGVETGVQNFSIAILVLRFALPEPECDLVLVVPVCFIIFSGMPVWLLLLARTVLKRTCKKTDKAPADVEMKAKLPVTDAEVAKPPELEPLSKEQML